MVCPPPLDRCALALMVRAIRIFRGHLHGPRAWPNFSQAAVPGLLEHQHQYLQSVGSLSNSNEICSAVVLAQK